MNITVTGASGLIGRQLLKVLAQEGHALYVLSRHAGTNLPPGVRLSRWDPQRSEPAPQSLAEADAVIHLAGESVSQRWTALAKHRILESRVLSTSHLVQGLAKQARKPEVLISASAIGYYGSRGDEVLTEAAPAGTGYLPDVCRAWEAEATAAEALGIRVVRLRIGVVLSARGGALQRMLPPFRLGVGGRLGSGRQWMSWIHIHDLVEMIRFALRQPLSGAVNGVAPYPVVNSDFTRTLADVLHRPAVFPVPSIALRVMFGEMAEVILGSQRVSPRVAETAAFPFRFPQLGPALADLLK